MIYKECRVCKEIKLIDSFSKKTSSKDGHMNICKICDAKKSLNWHYNNSEKAKDRKKNTEIKTKNMFLKKIKKDIMVIKKMFLFKERNITTITRKKLYLMYPNGKRTTLIK